MDTITHGIVGALIGKGYFSERQGRVAVFAATVGAMFPDVDVVREIFSSDPLSIVKYHRGITHSFVAMPFFAVLFAWLTRWFARRRGIDAPSQGMLTLIYVVAIASHIILDGMTSFGTRIWDPISQRRVSWDMLFIIDFTFTSIALLPQVVAWVYRDRENLVGRAIRMWALFTLAALAVWQIGRAVQYPFHLWIVALASLIFAALFFLPARGDFGFRVTRAAWCRGGMYVLIVYIIACGFAHHAALQRVQSFAAENHVAVERMGAIPLPPSLLSWGGLIRSNDGVYQARMDLRNPAPPDFRFVADSPPDEFIARALRLPEVHLYLQFARFPVIRDEIEDGHHEIEFGEHRFVNPRRGSPQPFTYRVVFDAAGNVIEEGWLSNGLFQRRMKSISPPPRDGVSP
jgi:membrane-bound metal-dependent hydrolase YbcI (DUF457 family)